MAFDKSLLAPKHWPIWIGIGLLILIGNLPTPMGRALGRWCGQLFGFLARHRRGIAQRNLELCFPDRSADWRAQLLRANFAAMGIGIYEFARAWWGPTSRLESGLRIDGLEILKNLQKQGRGVLLLSGHFMTLDLCGRLLCSQQPAAAMYRRHRSAALEWAIRRGRLRYASDLFAREDLRAAVRFLRHGGVLWYAPDQDMRGKDCVFAAFFGVAASTITATHQLQRLTGAAVVPFFHHRDHDGNYLLRIGTPLADQPDESALEHTIRVNALIEQMVRAAPEQYLWVHRRFKTRPKGEPSVY